MAKTPYDPPKVGMSDKKLVKYRNTWAKLLAVQEGAGAAESFAGIEDYLRTSLAVAMEAASLFVEGAAKKLSPVDLGLLRASIAHRIKESQFGKVIGQVGTNVEYAPYQELGAPSINLPAANGGRGFLTPALNDNKSTVLKIVSDKMKDAIK